MSLKPYPKYKDSGVEWIGEVPEHWDTVRLKSIAHLNPSKSEVANLEKETELSFLPMEAIGEKGDLDLSRTRTIAEVSTGYSYFADGDVVFAKVTPCFENGKGALLAGLVEGKGFGTTELTVLRPLDAGDGPYLWWFTVSQFFRGPATAEMLGAGGLKRVPDQFVADFRLPLPPPGERAILSKFLARETAKIDALITEQEKLIELLAEKRQATISHAVTKGLNPNAKMKDSGVEWLGEVPEHWTLRPLKHLARLVSGGTPSKERLDYWNGEIPWASAKDLKSERISDTIDHITTAAVDDGAASLVDSGSVLVLVRGMMLARMFPVVQTTVPMAINQDVKAVSGRTGVNNEYLAWLLRGTASETLNRLDEAGHGTKALRMEAWTSLKLPFPAEQEQTEIAKFLAAETAKLDDLALQANSAIDLLKERRTALISASITGKIDVRAVIESEKAAA